MNVGLLRQRNFGLLWCAGLISMTGDWALRIAMPVYVLRLTGSTAAVSGVVAASLLATLLFGTFAGAFADRWDRRRIVVAVNFLQALVLLPLLLVTHASQLWIAIAVAFAEAALAQFFMPAEAALLPNLVPATQLPAANALNSLNSNVARLLGPAVGGLLAVGLGLGGSAVVDAVSYAAAGLLCLAIRGAYRAERRDEGTGILRDLADGLRAAGRNRIVRALVVSITLISIGEGMMASLFAAFVSRAMHGTARDLGATMSAQAIGGILGSLAATRVAGRYRPVPLITVCWVLFGLGDIAIFNAPRLGGGLWVILALFVLVGLPVGVAFAAMMTLVQNQTEDHVRGRVFAVAMVSQAVAGMLGAGIAATLGGSVNVMTLLTFHGAGAVVAALLLRVIAGRGPERLDTGTAGSAGLELVTDNLGPDAAAGALVAGGPAVSTALAAPPAVV